MRPGRAGWMTMDALLEVVRNTWGYPGLRPLQREAMEASLAGRDALVVLPTGGGKSLCYQAPALLAPSLTLVVSPLISLMKDQVDRLLARGVAAAFLNSSLEAADRNRVQAAVLRGETRLLFVAPERFAAAGFDRLLGLARVRALAIDEAHCISHWGHDFRADYRALGRLKRLLPGAPVHAFTATATPRVRADIAAQLGLVDPAIFVGDFFRPNLRFRVAERTGGTADVAGEVRRRAGQPGIVYCIRRRDVDDLAGRLAASGVRAVGYHAGMEDAARARAQDRWIAGEADVVVATVAFGMGIDRADVRYVIHAAMPQSLEHYQQEAGRAGRDGDPADCLLLWSPADYGLWQSLMGTRESPDAPNKLRLLTQMYRFCSGSRCRHRTLVEYFGQAWTAGPCGACDVCAVTGPSAGGRPRPARRKAPEAPALPDPGLFESLRRVRRAIADERNLPAFMILSDATLRALSRLRPATRADLERVPGIGPFKAEAYGPRLLEAIRAGPEEGTDAR